MEVRTANYLQSAVSVDKLPAETLPEYAFVGRSNVGKSSLINAICGRNKLAITSSKPGRTQTINHFLINECWYLADLPGYGYAKVSKKSREKWNAMIRTYIRRRPNLVNVFLLVDMRVKPMDSDLDFIHFLGREGIPFVITFTKSDKVKQSAIAGTLKAYDDLLAETWSETPKMIVTSALKGRGSDEILEYIASGNEAFEQRDVLPE